jgi:hypothetical protein
MKPYDSGQTKRLLADVAREIARQNQLLCDAASGSEAAMELFRPTIEFRLAERSITNPWSGATRA